MIHFKHTEKSLKKIISQINLSINKVLENPVNSYKIFKRLLILISKEKRIIDVEFYPFISIENPEKLILKIKMDIDNNINEILRKLQNNSFNIKKYLENLKDICKIL